MYICTLLLTIASTAFAIVVQSPLGMYGVSSAAMELTDHTRKDPYAAVAGLDQPRRLMISTFKPIGLSNSCEQYIQPYMPPATAAIYDQTYDSLGLPSGIFGSLELSFCRDQSQNNGIAKDVSFPVVIFSPGLGNSRLIYSGIAQSLASQGYAVVTVDHPYDAAIVEYPDGTYVLAANITTPDQITFALNTRVKDISFVLEKIHSLFGSSSSRLKFSHFLLYGHSLGGATAVTTMSSDWRVVGAINLDGSLWGQVISDGVQCPVLLFAHQGKSLTTDPSWKKMWLNTAHTTKVELQLYNSTEGSFTDFPLLAETIGGGRIPDGLQGLIGQLPGTTVNEILNGCMGHFFQFSLNYASMPVMANNGTISPHVAVLEEVVDGRCATHCAGDL